uniref:AB hydrolase-1 domain-containing protein n=1 Tax=Timema poppense TaxID=170557 RepID=A0A7R9D971_TIMPO|nr:unnamed protein product [Timema poppensis]
MTCSRCSLGAAVARYRCEQVGQLVLISGGGPTPLAPRTADSKTPALPFCLQICLKPLLMCGFRRNILYAPCGKHINSNAAISGGVPQYVLQHIAHGQDWPEGDSTFHRRILVPTLIVHGMRDPYVTLVQECEMERTIPRSFLEVIPNAGHLPMLETPSQLSHMIHCFIDWWSSSSIPYSPSSSLDSVAPGDVFRLFFHSFLPLFIAGLLLLPDYIGVVEEHPQLVSVVDILRLIAPKDVSEQGHPIPHWRCVHR